MTSAPLAPAGGTEASEPPAPRAGTETSNPPAEAPDPAPPPSLAARPAIFLIRVYQVLLGPFLGGHCRFSPSCSVYGIQALERHGLLKGVALTAWRLLRCNPLCKGGYDPP